MFLKRCRLLLKRIYYSFAMFKEENIAAAQLAQIFGSQLLSVQESAITDSGSRPSILTMDPKQFLIDNSPEANARNKAREQRITAQLQREAEASCPLPPETPLVPVNPIQKPLDSVVLASPITTNVSTSYGINPSDLLKNVERIANSLETIAGAIGKRPVAKKSKKKSVVK